MRFAAWQSFTISGEFTYLDAAQAPGGNAEAAPLDDRYTQISNTFGIPIAFAPGFEMPLD